jgi:hypothetical protein
MLPFHLRRIPSDMDYGRGAHRPVLVLLLQTEETALSLPSVMECTDKRKNESVLVHLAVAYRLICVKLRGNFGTTYLPTYRQ